MSLGLLMFFVYVVLAFMVLAFFMVLALGKKLTRSMPLGLHFDATNHLLY